MFVDHLQSDQHFSMASFGTLMPTELRKGNQTVLFDEATFAELNEWRRGLSTIEGCKYKPRPRFDSSGVAIQEEPLDFVSLDDAKLELLKKFPLTDIDTEHSGRNLELHIRFDAGVEAIVIHRI